MDRGDPRPVTTAVDTNVLIDLLSGSQSDSDLAAAALEAVAGKDTLRISVVCYAELSSRFTLRINLDQLLDHLGFLVDVLDRQTSYAAGQLYLEYRSRGGTRDRILPDFLIAAHAQIEADRLLTRDLRFFRGTFPKLEVVSPADLVAG